MMWGGDLEKPESLEAMGKREKLSERSQSSEDLSSHISLAVSPFFSPFPQNGGRAFSQDNKQMWHAITLFNAHLD